MVIALRSCKAARLAQRRAWCASFSICGWTYPLPCHLYLKAFPNDPNTISLANGEWYCVRVVRHVTGDEN